MKAEIFSMQTTEVVEKAKKEKEIVNDMMEKLEEVFDYDIVPSKKIYILRAIYEDYKENK